MRSVSPSSCSAKELDSSPVPLCNILELWESDFFLNISKKSYSKSDLNAILITTVLIVARTSGNE